MVDGQLLAAAVVKKERACRSLTELSWARPDRYVPFWVCPIRPPGFTSARSTHFGEDRNRLHVLALTRNGMAVPEVRKFDADTIHRTYALLGAPLKR